MAPKVSQRMVPAWPREALLVAVTALATVSAGGAVAVAAEPHLQLMVSRAFTPDRIVLRPGEAVYIVNDDGVAVHHPYISGADFSYDDGDLSPGHDSRIDFTVAGSFVLRCAIHPNLRSRITVR